MEKAQGTRTGRSGSWTLLQRVIILVNAVLSEVHEILLPTAWCEGILHRKIFPALAGIATGHTHTMLAVLPETTVGPELLHLNLLFFDSLTWIFFWMLPSFVLFWTSWHDLCWKGKVEFSRKPWFKTSIFWPDRCTFPGRLKRCPLRFCFHSFYVQELWAQNWVAVVFYELWMNAAWQWNTAVAWCVARVIC